jgi:hypothetical protein
VIVTASLTTGIARVSHGIIASAQLVDEIFRTDHVEWETTLHVGDVEFHCTKDGPFPNHQLRISVRPSVGYAALNYMDHAIHACQLQTHSIQDAHCPACA